MTVEGGSESPTGAGDGLLQHERGCHVKLMTACYKFEPIFFRSNRRAVAEKEKSRSIVLKTSEFNLSG